MGPTGPQGASGAQGFNGASGIQGPVGPTGPSAFFQAVSFGPDPYPMPSVVTSVGASGGSGASGPCNPSASEYPFPDGIVQFIPSQTGFSLPPNAANTQYQVLETVSFSANFGTDPNSGLPEAAYAYPCIAVNLGGGAFATPIKFDQFTSYQDGTNNDDGYTMSMTVAGGTTASEPIPPLSSTTNYAVGVCLVGMCGGGGTPYPFPQGDADNYLDDAGRDQVIQNAWVSGNIQITIIPSD